MKKAVVIGCSAGGLTVLTAVLETLPRHYTIPVIVVQHRANEHNHLLEEVLQHKCTIQVKQADEKESIQSGIIYVAPPGYHLLIESDRTFSLAADVRVQYSMPSIDVTFETAAETYRQGLTGILMTGANSDGAQGIQKVKEFMGTTIAQDPREAQHPTMPMAAIATGKVDQILNTIGIRKYLTDLPLISKV